MGNCETNKMSTTDDVKLVYARLAEMWTLPK